MKSILLLILTLLMASCCSKTDSNTNASANSRQQREYPFYQSASVFEYFEVPDSMLDKYSQWILECNSRTRLDFCKKEAMDLFGKRYYGVKVEVDPGPNESNYYMELFPTKGDFIPPQFQTLLDPEQIRGKSR